MTHPLLQSPQGVKQVIHGLMREDAASCGASVNSMLNFFWQATENFQTMASGAFFREGDTVLPGIHEATKALSGAIMVTNCFMVDPLAIEIDNVIVSIDHKNIACFIEKPDSEDKRLATRVYFNPVDKMFLAVGMEYSGKETPGPFAPGGQSRFVRLYPVPTATDQIFEIMISLLSSSIEEPDCIRHVYRPLH